MNDSISKAIAVIRDSPSSDDVEVYRKLVGEGIEPLLAARLIEFLPMAYCRLLLESSGVRFSENYQRKLSDGRIPQEQALISLPVWNAMMAFGRDEIRRGLSPKDLLAVALRSAEFQAVNRLLNKGSKLSDLVLTPTLLTWPEHGPESDG
jgi:hypothetical protein